MSNPPADAPPPLRGECWANPMRGDIPACGDPGNLSENSRAPTRLAFGLGAPNPLAQCSLGEGRAKCSGKASSPRRLP